MEEIKKYLQEDEKVLWKRREVKNLLSFISFYIYVGIFIVLSGIIVSIIGVLLGFSNMIIFINFNIILVIIGEVSFFLFAINDYKKMRKRLRLTPKELKNYEFYDVITNKRFIQRNFYLNYRRDLSEYYGDIIEQIGDTVFLKLDRIEVCIVNYYKQKIIFLSKYHLELIDKLDYVELIDYLSPSAFDLFDLIYIDLSKKKLVLKKKPEKIDELNKIMEILKNILPLERKEHYLGGEIYIRK